MIKQNATINCSHKNIWIFFHQCWSKCVKKVTLVGYSSFSGQRDTIYAKLIDILQVTNCLGSRIHTSDNLLWLCLCHILNIWACTFKYAMLIRKIQDLIICVDHLAKNGVAQDHDCTSWNASPFVDLLHYFDFVIDKC